MYVRHYLKKRVLLYFAFFLVHTEYSFGVYQFIRVLSPLGFYPSSHKLNFLYLTFTLC